MILLFKIMVFVFGMFETCQVMIIDVYEQFVLGTCMHTACI